MPLRTRLSSPYMDACEWRRIGHRHACVWITVWYIHTYSLIVGLCNKCCAELVESGSRMRSSAAVWLYVILQLRAHMDSLAGHACTGTCPARTGSSKESKIKHLTKKSEHSRADAGALALNLHAVAQQGKGHGRRGVKAPHFCGHLQSLYSKP